MCTLGEGGCEERVENRKWKSGALDKWHHCIAKEIAFVYPVCIGVEFSIVFRSIPYIVLKSILPKCKLILFIGHLDKLQGAHKEADEESNPVERPVRGAGGDKHIFKPTCIFCGIEGYRKVYVKGVRTSENTRYFSRDGDKLVWKAAEAKADEKLLKRIRGFDLFACEAKYHHTCRATYISSERNKVEDNDEDNEESEAAIRKRNIKHQMEMTEAHKSAYATVSGYVANHIVCHRNVCKLVDLRDIYIRKLSETDFANPQFRSLKLKDKLEKDNTLSHLVDFVKVPSSRAPIYIVYAKSISVSEAVSKAYQLAHRDMLKDVALDLAATIKTAHRNSSKLKWPPTARDLVADEAEIPHDVLRFFTLVICGKDVNYSQRAERLAFSIRSDLCRASTNGEWSLTKHILLTVTLRHLYRGKEVS